MADNRKKQSYFAVQDIESDEHNSLLCYLCKNLLLKNLVCFLVCVILEIVGPVNTGLNGSERAVKRKSHRHLSSSDPHHRSFADIIPNYSEGESPPNLTTHDQITQREIHGTLMERDQITTSKIHLWCESLWVRDPLWQLLPFLQWKIQSQKSNC